MYFRLGEIYANAGKKTEAVDALTKAAQIGKGTIIEAYAKQSLKDLESK